MDGICDELGISGGTALVVLIALYFVVKWAVRNGIEEAYERRSGGILKRALLQIMMITT